MNVHSEVVTGVPFSNSIEELRLVNKIVSALREKDGNEALDGIILFFNQSSMKANKATIDRIPIL